MVLLIIIISTFEATFCSKRQLPVKLTSFVDEKMTWRRSNKKREKNVHLFFAKLLYVRKSNRHGNRFSDERIQYANARKWKFISIKSDVMFKWHHQLIFGCQSEWKICGKLFLCESSGQIESRTAKQNYNIFSSIYLFIIIMSRPGLGFKFNKWHTIPGGTETHSQSGRIASPECVIIQ